MLFLSTLIPGRKLKCAFVIVIITEKCELRWSTHLIAVLQFKF